MKKIGVVAGLLVAKAQVAAIFESRRVANVRLLDVDLFESARTASYVVDLVAELVLQLDAHVVAFDERGRVAREIKRIAAARVKSAIAFKAVDLLATALRVRIRVDRDSQRIQHKNNEKHDAAFHLMSCLSE